MSSKDSRTVRSGGKLRDNIKELPIAIGYDPIFYVPDLNCSTAELSPEEKNARSHRGNALRAMREELKQYISDGR